MFHLDVDCLFTFVNAIILLMLIFSFGGATSDRESIAGEQATGERSVVAVVYCIFSR